MRIPDGTLLLDLAETLSSLGATRRSIHMLAACDPTLTREAAAGLDIGRFDARLLDLCEVCLGTTLAARAHCPSCRAALDLALETRSLRQEAGAGDAELRIVRGEVALRFRHPTARDLAMIEHEPDPVAARRALLERCVVALDGADALDDGLRDAMSAALGAAAPQADVAVALACAACGHEWEALLDLGAFLWSDFSSRAELLLQDVHVLAGAYHWSEEAILTMPPSRRRRYIELVQP